MLSELSLEQLLEVPITSVSRRSESLAGAAASVFVITSDDIRRSGASTLPEALRLAPNLQVAQNDNAQFSITARGFNNSIGNKLLVLIDGRAVYTPLFSGVFWEMQDTLLEDIERIEVISGPGATLWGANAVNGVINVITKNSADTAETLVRADHGNNAYGGAVRIGGHWSDRGSWRVYGKARDWDNTYRADDTAAQDDWKRQQFGFRVDWADNRDQFTFQGDSIRGGSEHRGIINGLELTPLEFEENNLLVRWTHYLANGSNFDIQAYWTQSERQEIFLFSPKSDVYDIEIKHEIQVGNHHVVWGGGIRRGSDEIADGLFIRFIPDERSLGFENIFVQDDIRLRDSLQLTLGAKLEWNDYTGMEHLPSARLSWEFAEDHTLWGAVARAVRSPSRFDRDVFLPEEPPFLVAGGPDFEAEIALVSSIGYRGQPTEMFNFALTLFHHDWDRLRSGTLPPLPVYIENDIEGEAFGLEGWANIQLRDTWRVQAGFTMLEKDLWFKPAKGDTVGVDNPTLHNDPAYQLMLRSSFDLGYDMLLDMQLRHVAALRTEPVPAYTELDLSWAWRVSEDLEVFLTGRNLLDKSHPEFGGIDNRSELRRSFLAGVKWTP